MKIGKFTFKYIQVPYDGRFYVVLHENPPFGVEKIAQFRATTSNRIIFDTLWYLAISEADDVEHGVVPRFRLTQGDRFFGRMEQYDTYLERTDQ